MSEPDKGDVLEPTTRASNANPERNALDAEEATGPIV